MAELVNPASKRSVTTLRSIGSGEDLSEFKKFHLFVFKYHLIQAGQKVLQIDTALALLKMVVLKLFPMCEQFIQFLSVSGKSTLTQDQWLNVLEVLPILQSKQHYDIAGACILLAAATSRAHAL